MDGRIVPPVATTPAELMADAIREFRAAQAQFDMATTPEEIDAACSRLRAAEDRMVLIAADAGRRPARATWPPCHLPWVSMAAERRRLRCAG